MNVCMYVREEYIIFSKSGTEEWNPKRNPDLCVDLQRFGNREEDAL